MLNRSRKQKIEGVFEQKVLESLPAQLGGSRRGEKGEERELLPGLVARAPLSVL